MNRVKAIKDIYKISKERADLLRHLGYSVGMLFIRKGYGGASDEYAQALFPKQIEDEELDEELDYYYKLGYEDLSWFILQETQDRAAIHIKFDDGSNPYIKYFFHGKNLEDLLIEVNKWKENYKLHDPYVSNDILYINAQNKLAKEVS